ncbi:amino acid/amide ABC transporter substrate-binding protein, HAAT family [Pseudonocardia thermophila]|jgi:ABC-type branched-chain amino acid transport systems, periplasmic component|uniref:Amino acid/amide ABC transporter substrate-binding protein, HAAT family n=1 Tax=Pseudonocardia thermophila TaxID=1848 RepID=A0A1M6Q2Z4_PSETH|nr:substrate-binding protein [Pseudonocardia thermophila]SHK14602.1 amino acid/amide ABC transporter substrate-binding protein, HAAT family [Pseudonocardia thermophila]
MPELVLAATKDLPQSAEEVFALFGARSGASWLFDVQCDSLRPGTPVTLTLPHGSLGETPVHLLGRIRRVVPNKLVEIVHDQPWPGLLQIRIRAHRTGGSSVSIVGHVDDRALRWVMQRRGWPLSTPCTGHTHRIGLLTSKIGSAAVYAIATEYLAQLAVEEINADGGIGGRPIELIVGDDGTDPGRAALEARRLLAAGCRAVIASVTSASFAAIEPIVAGAGRPLIHSVVNEGGAGPELVLRWGERPLHQVRTAAHAVMKNAGGRRWYLLGNDYQWPHGAHRAATRVLTAAGCEITRNRFVPIGTEDFAPLLEDIERSGADCVLSTLIGADEVAFERQAWEGGYRQRWETLSLVLDESTRERVGDAAARGIWTTFGYFEELDTPENRDLVARYRERYGEWAPPLSSLSESVYEAVLLYAAAARREPDPSGIAQALRAARGRMPRGNVAAQGPHAMRQDMYLARAVDGGFAIMTG